MHNIRTVRNVPVLFLFFSMLLLSSCFRLKVRIISREEWFNYIVTFFFEKIMPKIWVGWTTLNREKKEDSQKEIISIMDATFAVVKRKPEKIRACKGFEPFDLELQYLKVQWS